MDCLEAAEIRRYVQGTMDDREADQVSRHLVSCKVCRKAVAQVRGTTDPEGSASAAKKLERKPALVKVKCQQCNARYGIPENRVHGRMLKIRCKNCSNIIEVWSSESTIRSVIDRGRKLWFLVIKRQRVGPMTEQEVRERFNRGECKAKTYAWRQGFSKWERLYNISELGDLARGDTPTPSINAQPTRKGEVGFQDPERTEKARPPRAYVRATERSASGSEDLDFDRQTVDSLAQTAFRSGSAPAELPDDTSDSAARTRVPEENPSDSAVRTACLPEEGHSATDGRLTHIHTGQKETGPSGAEEMTANYDARSEASWDRQFADPDAAPPAQPSPRLQDGEWERHMKGQRREESVLFSLGHLKNLAASAPPAGGGDDRSVAGLFDIKPTLGPPATALLMPEEPERPRRGFGVILGAALLGVVLGAGVLLGALYLVQPGLVKALISGEQVTVIAGTPVDGGTLLASASPAPEAIPIKPRDAGPVADAPGAALPDSAGVPDAAVPAPPAPRRSATRQRRSRPRRARAIKVVDPDVAEEPAEPDVPEAPSTPPSVPRVAPSKKGGTQLDRLIDDATGPEGIKKRPGKPGPAAGSEPKLPRTLTREQVAAGMKRAGVHGCYQRFREPGIVMVSATIDGATGRISRARVVGGFAGTSSGQCVLTVVRGACVFPRFSGPPLTLKYPFMLR